MEAHIGPIIKNYAIVSLIAMAGELNFITQKKGLGLDRGIALLLEENSPEAVMKVFSEKANAVEVINLKLKKETVRNYQIAMHKLTKYDKEEQLFSFLKTKDFLPIVIVSGIVPDFLKSLVHVIRFSEENFKGMQSNSFDSELKNGRKFVRDNPELMMYELNSLKRSKSIYNSTFQSPLFTCLCSAAYVFRMFFRSYLDEIRTNRNFDIMMDKIKECVQEADEIWDEYDAIGAIKNVINLYFDQNKCYEIRNIDHVDEKLNKAVMEENLILYDKNFYFIPQHLFHKSCAALMNVLSIIEIKKLLHNEEIISCNDTTSQNYTVKKMFTTVNGTVHRKRYVKIIKDFLCSQDGLYLEERKETKKDVHRESRRKLLLGQ